MDIANLMNVNLMAEQARISLETAQCWQFSILVTRGALIWR